MRQADVVSSARLITRSYIIDQPRIMESALSQFIKRQATTIEPQVIVNERRIMDTDRNTPKTADLWLAEDRALALEAALQRVMRNQARLLKAWAEGERYDEDGDACGELAASRNQAKAALSMPQPRFSIRPGDARVKRTGLYADPLSDQRS